MIQLGKNLVAASHRHDAAEIGWLSECKDKSFEDLADSGPSRFAKLDLKLSANLMEAIRGSPDAINFLNDLSILEEAAHAQNAIIKGRQIVRLILEHFQTDRHLDSMWQIDDLFHLKYPGDAKMSLFRNVWHRIVSCLAGEVREDFLRKQLRIKLGESKGA